MQHLENGTKAESAWALHSKPADTITYTDVSKFSLVVIERKKLNGLTIVLQTVFFRTVEILATDIE